MPSMPPCKSSMESPDVTLSSSAHQQALVGISSSGRSTGPKPSVSCVSSLNFLNMVTSHVTSTSPKASEPFPSGCSLSTSSTLTLVFKSASV